MENNNGKSAKKPKKKKKAPSTSIVIQGYDLTTAKYRVNLYQKRMMLAVASAAQAKLQGERNIAGRQLKVEEKEFPIISIPLDLILQDDDSSNVFAVRKAAKGLVSRVVDYEDKEGNYIAFAPFTTAEIPRYGSELKIQVHKMFWEAILDFRSGYRKIDAKRAISLKSVYAIRFYELLSGKTEPITYSVVELKDMFMVKDKYKQINDFMRFVLDPAKRELDASAPYSFDYEPVKDGRRIIAFRFLPIHYPHRDNPEAEERDLQRKQNLSWEIPDRHVRRYLLDDIGFTEVEIKNNIEVFRQAAALLPDALHTLSILKGKSRDKDNPKGWIINALKGKVKDVIALLNDKNTYLDSASSPEKTQEVSPNNGASSTEMQTKFNEIQAEIMNKFGFN